MKFVLLLLFTTSFSGILSETVEVKNKCKCKDILTIKECNQNCEWNYQLGECKESNSLIRTSYCQYKNDKCNQTIGCANYNGICVPFTGCTAIKQNTNFECLKYSNLCITDGSKCVQIGVCSDYKTRFSCRNNYINNQWQGYCYWDKQGCRIANKCNELPFSLKSDKDCRKELSQCTYKQGGGCEDSGEQCKDQKLQQQCVKNKNNNVDCYWDGQTCNTYSCKYITKDCLKHKCSIDQNQKCIDRLECSEYLIQISCTFDKSDNQCMWEYNTCKVKSCENASIQRQTNEQCQEIDQLCITKYGGGCKQNGECEEAKNKVGCVQNTKREPCYWNGYICVLKQCSWAPAQYQDIQKCKDFKSNCVYNGKSCLEDGCYAQTNAQKCASQQQCKWLNKCDIKTCETAGNDNNYITHTDCQNYLSTCTLSDTGIGCMMIKYSCSSYNRQIQCYQSLQSKCIWYDNKCQDISCDKLTYSTHDECNYELKSCTSDGKKCIQIKSSCQSYTSEMSCNINSSMIPCYWSNNQCKNFTCNLIPKSYSFNTHQECNNYQSQCTVLERIQGCIIMPTDCSLLNQYQCYGTNCVFSNGVCREKQCKDYKGDYTQYNCETYISGKKCMRGPGLTPNGCVDRINQCADIKTEFQCNDAKDVDNIKCQWTYSYCIKWTQRLEKRVGDECSKEQIYCLKDKDCSDSGIDTVQYTNYICENYYIKCQKANDTSCVLKSGLTGCSYYVSQTYCIQQTNCYWSSDEICKEHENSCSTLKENDCSGNRDSSGTSCKWSETCKDICSTLEPNSTSCSILDSNCVLQNIIPPYKCTKKQTCNDYSESQIICEDDKRCRYNESDKKCYERQCSDLTTDLSHAECNEYKSECTMAYPGGCTDLQQNCSDYKSQIQCNLNNKQQLCFWSESKGCVDRKCSEITFESNKPKKQCQNFYTDLNCNVNDEQNACEDLRDSCNQYKSEIQCYRQLDQQECMWEKGECKLASCQDIVISEYSHNDCYNQFEKLKCTIKDSMNGCIQLVSDCKLYTVQSQCHKTSQNEDCVWNETYQTCNFKGCQDEIPEDQKCSQYHSKCIETKYYCRNTICEDYQEDNDQSCRQRLKSCTSNGRYCIQRGTCEQNQYQQACNIDINDKYCGWNTAMRKCQYLQCQDAPSELNFNCDKYFPDQNCVAKLGGGCLIVTSCYDYTIQAQCDGSKLFSCIWDNESCRSKVCTDFKYSNLLDCQSTQLDCITDGKTCINSIPCSQLSQKYCLIGSDGNCLFINGSCYPYNSCQSISFTTHQQCYNALQQQCTTDGTKCIPITSCDEYTNNISCVIGTEGICAWNDSKCTKFSSCDNYLFKTHQECNSINQSCTTDANTQCMKLKKCNEYENEENCKLNTDGIVIDNGLITQLDTCVWIDKKCQNTSCEHLYGTNHLKCNQQLSTCTSDGTKCIKMQSKCSSYANEICDSSFSSEGQCTKNASNCSVVICSTATSETQCNTLSHCKFINKSCQFYLKCQEYSTENECTQGTDGQCLYKNSKCQQMTQCTDANKQEFCDPKTCYWNTTSCLQHTCQTYAIYNPCGLYYNYQRTQITYCAFNDTAQQCNQISPNSFNIDDCYTKSLGYFINRNGTCESCFPIPINNSTTNGTNNTNSTDNSSYFLGIIFLALLLIFN